MAKPKSGVKPTTKRAARIAGLGVGMFAVVCALLWLRPGEPESQGPLIRGKPVAYWTRQLRLAQVGPEVISALASEKGLTIPALVQQLSLPDSRVRDVVKGLWRRMPAMLRVTVAEPTTNTELRAGAAYALYRFFEPGDEPSLSEAQMMLPALTKALQDKNVNVRLFATMALGNSALCRGRRLSHALSL